jgi:predicted Zn-dependent protease
LKKYLVILFILLCAVVMVSGCVTDNKNNNETQTYSQNNVSFNYPGGWATANPTAPNAVAAVADPKSIQSGSPSTVVIIQKPNATASNLSAAYAANYATFFNNTGYQQVSEGNITVNGTGALENVYATNSTNPREYRAVWLNENGTVYVILCVANQNDFKNEQANFNLIINSFSAK